jgi:malate permease and related proteins
MLELATPILRVLIFVGAGMLCRYLRVIDPAAPPHFSRLVFNLVLPCMLFMASFEADIQTFRGPAMAAFAAGMVIPAAALVVGHLLARLGKVTPQQRQVIRTGAAFPNTAFFGIPICTSFFGPQGALLAGFFDQGATLPFFILGPLSFARKPDLRSIGKALFNPMLAAMLLGGLLNMLHLELPDLLLDPLRSVGNMSTPLALILVGSLIDLRAIRKIAIRPLSILVTARLLIVPLLVAACLAPFALDSVLRNVLVFQSAMPASVVGTMMAFEYQSDTDLAVQGNLFSMFLLLVTISGFALLMR